MLILQQSFMVIVLYTARNTEISEKCIKTYKL